MKPDAHQQSLFGDTALTTPAPAFNAHTVEVIGDSVRVRLRIATNPVDDEGWSTQTEVIESLITGPLTYAECVTWILPCKLYQCRHRLDDAVELRTRHDDAPGDWCALRVADEERNKLTIRGPDTEEPIARIAELFGITKKRARKQLVEPAVAALREADVDDVLEEHYGVRGRIHKIKFIPVNDDITSAMAKRMVVPGEERCACVAPVGDKGKVCGTCGLKIKMGRQSLWVRGRRRSRKDQWDGVTRVIPVEFQGRVDVRLLNSAHANDVVPAQFSDMGKMLASRAEARREKQIRARGEAA